MARGTSPFGSPPKKASEPPAPRNIAFETTLCNAIRNGVLVELRYEDDAFARAYAPYVVYRTATGKYCAFGMQVNKTNPNDRNDPHNFEVGKMRSVTLTTTKFTRDPRFNLSDAKYRNRVCPI